MKKKSGPNTTKGKLVSAQNAIKTGVTTKQLLNEEEYSRFAQLQADLTNHYNGTNPLIALQIEKIGRLQIQLERIQNAIDALYRKTELNPPRKEKNDYSPVDSATLSLHLRIRLRLFDASIIQKIRTAHLQMKVKKFLDEPLTRDHPMWQAMPQRMLRHKTLQQCTRLAFGISAPQVNQRKIIMSQSKSNLLIQKIHPQNVKVLLREHLDVSNINR